MANSEIMVTMVGEPLQPQDMKILLAAVQNWYRHFGIDASQRDMEQLCRAAFTLFIDGCTHLEDLAERLLELFPTPELLKINAPSSNSVH